MHQQRDGQADKRGMRADEGNSPEYRDCQQQREYREQHWLGEMEVLGGMRQRLVCELEICRDIGQLKLARHLWPRALHRWP